MRKKRQKFGDKLFYTLTIIVLTVFFLMVLYPCIFVVSSSFSSGNAVQTGKVFLFPVEFTLDGYEMVIHNKDVVSGFINSMFYTVVGTGINLVVTMICAYVLSRPDLPGKNGIMIYFMITMYFSGGLIPSYLVIKKLGLVGTRWALLLPGALGVYNMIMARTFIQSNIPNEILESAKIDGCGDFMYFTKMVLPLSKAVMAVQALLYGVGHWNEYFNAMIYLNKREQYPLTIILKEILLANQIDPSTIANPELQARITEMAAVMKYSLIVVSMIPILLIYPFIQRYFVKGVMIGSVKG